MEKTQITDETCIIVSKTAGLMTGVLVGKVLEVVNMVEGDIKYAPSFGVVVDTEYLLGVGKNGGRVRLLLNIEKIITASDIVHLKKAAETSG